MTPGTASLARETRARRYRYGTRPAFWHKAELRFFPREWRARSTREFSSVLSTGITREMHTRVGAHPTRLIVPPVSILHTSLSNAERMASLGNNGKFQRTYERGDGTLSSPTEIFYAVPLPREFVKAHGHSVPWNRSAAAERRECTENRERFLLKKTTHDSQCESQL